MARVDVDVLDHCLLLIQSSEATVEDCLAENPAYAEVLGPLLSVAAVTRAQLFPDGPSPAFVAHSPKRVMNLAKARARASAPSMPRRALWTWRPAYRFASVLIALALLIGSVGVAYASDEALPGDDLYGVKRGLERAALAISLSAAGDAELLLKQANRRIAEVEELVRRGRGGDVGPALEGYEHAVRTGLEIASEPGAALDDLEAALGNHEQVLAAVLAEAPEQAVPGLTRALENSRKGRKEVEQIRSDQRPSEAAPGQLKKTTDPLGDASELPPGKPKKDAAQERDLPPGQLRKTPTPESIGSD